MHTNVVAWQHDSISTGVLFKTATTPCTPFIHPPTHLLTYSPPYRSNTNHAVSFPRTHLHSINSTVFNSFLRAYISHEFLPTLCDHLPQFNRLRDSQHESGFVTTSLRIVEIQLFSDSFGNPEAFHPAMDPLIMNARKFNVQR